MVDLTGDGKPDIISGSWPGELYIFEGGEKRSFSGPKKLKYATGADINVGKASAVYAVDWDGDQDLDLLVGNIQGDIRFIEKTKEGFAAWQPVKADGKQIRVDRGDSAPAVADWDGDGKLDLLTGSGAGEVIWFRNIGTVGKPKLAAGATLLRGSDGKDNSVHGLRTKICVTDWNEDGHLDLLVGDFAVRQVKLSDEDREKVKAGQERMSDLGNEYRKAYRPKKGETPEESKARNAEVKRLREEMNKLSRSLPKSTEYLGRVWIYEKRAPRKDY